MGSIANRGVVPIANRIRGRPIIAGRPHQTYLGYETARRADGRRGTPDRAVTRPVGEGRSHRDSTEWTCPAEAVRHRGSGERPYWPYPRLPAGPTLLLGPCP